MWIDDFLELLYSKDSQKIEKAYELKDEKMPNHIYKYKAIDENGYTLDLLKTDLVYLSNADNLNDLYEGEYFYDDQELFFSMFESKIIENFIEKTELNDKELNKITSSKTPYFELQKLIYETDPIVNRNIPFDEFYEKSLDIVLNMINKVFKDGNNFSKKNTYLTCFSKKNDLILMWSYYADSNKGICIKYDIKNDKHFIKRSCYPIKYEEEYHYTPELENIKENMFKLSYDPYLKKETNWEHEAEWRILFNNHLLLRSTIQIGDKHFLKLPKPTAVYLGKRITPENKEKIIDICKNREIPLYQMEKDMRRASLYEIPILKYSEKRWDDELFIIESIRNKTCRYLIRKYFYYRDTVKNSEDNFSRIISSFKDLTIDEIQFFLDELLFKKNIFPVLYPYYFNVLSFLTKLNDNKQFNNLKTCDGMTNEENLKQWTSYCISSFYDKKIVRYMIFFERLFIRFYNRYVILSDDEKAIYDTKLQKFELKNKYVTLIEEDAFEEFMYMHPFTTEDRTELIRDNILNNLQIMLDSFYIDGEFDEKSCYKEYFYLKSIVRKIENESEIWYNDVFENSKKYLPIFYSCLFNEYCDSQLQTSCSVLIKNKHVLKLVSSKDKHLLEVLGSINNTQRIANFIDECCKELNLNYKENVSGDVIEKYFNPKTNPYTLLD